jgi:hypothetical protein
MNVFLDCRNFGYLVPVAALSASFRNQRTLDSSAEDFDINDHNPSVFREYADFRIFPFFPIRKKIFFFK